MGRERILIDVAHKGAESSLIVGAIHPVHCSTELSVLNALHGPLGVSIGVLIRCQMQICMHMAQQATLVRRRGCTPRGQQGSILRAEFGNSTWIRDEACSRSSRTSFSKPLYTDCCQNDGAGSMLSVRMNQRRVVDQIDVFMTMDRYID